MTRTRRDFLKDTLKGTAGLAIGSMGFSAASYGRIMGANDRINVAVIGIRGQGQTHINRWCRLKDTRNVLLKTICDTDENVWPASVKAITDKCGVKPATEWDMRKVFDDKDIHAVSFATPNHWHALGTIWACQAGKHVYVEKPANHNIFEGRKMIEAARKYKVRVQVGLQNRSIPNVQQAIKFLHDGGIGDVYLSRGLCFKPRIHSALPMIVNRRRDFTTTCGWVLLHGESIMKRKVITIGIGIGIPATEIPVTRGRTNLISLAGV